jgi:N-acetylglutamate synthase-like GNAT family acetyltransferase
MYVRDAKNRDEVWLLDHIEAMELDETAFRSRDYVIVIDEQTGDRAGFGRIRVHRADDEEDETCELTSIGVLEDWRGQGVGAHVVERLVTTARDSGFEVAYVLTSESDYLDQFGFERIQPAQLPTVLQRRLQQKQDRAVPLRIGTDRFRMPSRLREAFKGAYADDEPEDPPEEPEDFGIDPDDATYKYDTDG